MGTHRAQLPQLSGRPFLTDGGLETTLIFHEGMDLPEFAAFPLVTGDEGIGTLDRYLSGYLQIAEDHQAGFIFESVTWRASEDWGAKLGYSRDDLAEVNRKAIALMARARERLSGRITEMVVSGCVGPRGDGYSPGHRMSAEEARRYHSHQVDTFADTEADMVTAMTLNYVEEAIGVVQAARQRGLPVVISFTVETDGRLPSGESLQEAIERTDEATEGAAAHFMVNCAHPTHFAPVLAGDDPWKDRLRGIRVNASALSHAELDEAEELDEGDPADLAVRCREIKELLPNLAVLGGCCGTDHRHVAEIAKACLPARE